jgi:hypothetical protein
LTADLPAERGSPTEHVDIDGYQVAFRLPSRSDVAIAAANGDDEGFAHRLLDRCTVGASEGARSLASADLPDAVVDAVSRRMELLDPVALVSFALECPECSVRWNAPLDIDQLLWVKVQATAERLLLDVDTLARAYGWTEREVLTLNPTRRAAYLQLAGA